MAEPDNGQDLSAAQRGEWEYAARGITDVRQLHTVYSWGNQVGKGNANCLGCGSRWDSKQTAPVGSFKANEFGLYNVHGNVSEWVRDCYSKNAYQAAPGMAPPSRINGIAIVCFVAGLGACTLAACDWHTGAKPRLSSRMSGSASVLPVILFLPVSP
jgi:formylglycine-generating enzyme required for sulfatase activity